MRPGILWAASTYIPRSPEARWILFPQLPWQSPQKCSMPKALGASNANLFVYLQKEKEDDSPNMFHTTHPPFQTSPNACCLGFPWTPTGSCLALPATSPDTHTAHRHAPDSMRLIPAQPLSQGAGLAGAGRAMMPSQSPFLVSVLHTFPMG